jgi:CubicO group peptidase (beta-lactamase class C family)
MAFSADGLKHLDQMLAAHIHQGAAPGLVAVVAKGLDTYVSVHGVMGLDDARPVRRDTIFRISSMTKPIVAAAAMMLIDDGKLALDEPITRLAPELADLRVLKSIEGPLDETVPAARAITVEDVLSFRLGWGIVFSDTYPIAQAVQGLPGFGMPDPRSPITPDGYIERLGELPLMAQPGERWMYNAGSALLGVLIARAAGAPLDRVLAERVFAPLGMADTSFGVPRDHVNRMITAYAPHEGALVLFDPPDGMFAIKPSFPGGEAGLVSTADDYVAFARFMQTGLTPSGRRLLSTEALQAMTTDRLTAAQRKDGSFILGLGRGWGLGVGVVAEDGVHWEPKGAYGWDGGFGSSWFNDPASGLCAILLTQRVFDSPEPPPLHQDFCKAALALLQA